MKKNIIIVTGGAGFIGSNLINKLQGFKKFNIISIDNYSTGRIVNHLVNYRIKYINGDTQNINHILKSKRKKIHTIFHFGEFSRIYQSFANFDECFNSNSNGSKAVFKFCLDNNIKLIYSATSASLGNKGNDQNLSPYAYTKSKNLELLENLKKWFKFKYEIIYFYNVYGPKQIKKGRMATVIGIFENQFKNYKPLTIVRPGRQSRRFTHVEDTVDACIYAWRKNLNKHYSIASKESYTIYQIAKMFGGKTKLLPERKGERYSSALTKMNLSNQVINLIGKKSIKKYIFEFIRNSR